MRDPEMFVGSGTGYAASFEAEDPACAGLEGALCTPMPTQVTDPAVAAAITAQAEGTKAAVGFMASSSLALSILFAFSVQKLLALFRQL